MLVLIVSLGVTRSEGIRNSYHQRDSSDSLVWRQRLRCFGHEERDSGYIRERMLNMELPGGRKRGRLQRRFTDVVKGHGESCGLQ